MSDDQTTTPPDSAPEPSESAAAGKRARVPRVGAGTVVAGRFRVVEPVASGAAHRIVEAADLLLADRRVLLAVVAGEDRERLARRWLDADTPWTATLLDVTTIEGAVVGVFELDADATPLDRVGGASREQRGAVLVDLARVLERTASCEGAYRVCGPGQLWVEGLPHDARLRAVVVPDAGADGPATRAEDLAALARLVGQHLFGVDPVTPPDRALAALPDGISSALAPWYSDDPTVRLSAPLSADGLSRVLGLGAGASRVPVPRAPAAPPNMLARVQAARSAVRKTTLRELGAAVALLAVTLFAGLGLFATDEVVVPEPQVESFVPAPSPSSESRAPLPTEVTYPPTDVMWSASEATLYHTLDEDAPVPSGIGPEIVFDERPLWLPYERVFRDAAGRVSRVEHFEVGDLFTGYSVYDYDEASGRLRSRSDFTSTGLPAWTRSYDWEARVFEERARDGAPTDPRCAAVRFALDDRGRFASHACLGRGGNPATFEGGYHEVRFTYADGELSSASARTSTVYDERGRPVRSWYGWSSVTETRSSDGRLVRREFFGPEGAPAVDVSTGAATVRYDYSLRTIRMRLFGVDGAPIEGASGWHAKQTYYREGGGMSGTSFTDVAGAAVAPTGTSVARIEYEADARRLVRQQAYFDVDGNRATDPSGTHRIEYVRDAHGNVMRECHFGLDGPIASPALEGVHCVLTALDSHGQTIGEAYYGTAGEPIVDSRTQVHRVSLTRDERGRIVERRYFDQDWEPAFSWSGYHGVRFAFDDWGDVVSYAYIDGSGQPATTSIAVSSVQLRRDRAGREVRRCFFDPQGAPVALASGFAAGAACIHTDWDEGGTVSSLRYTAVDGRPALAEFDPPHVAAQIDFFWAPDGRLVRQELLGTDGTALQERVCSVPNRCIDVSGWAWHVP